MKFLVIDDHMLIREAMRSVLRELDAGAEVLEAASGLQGTNLLALHADIGLVLLDLKLPDRDGLDVLAEERARHPELRVVMLSAANDRSTVMRALNGGAVGFIPKTESREVLLNALRLVLAGSVYIPMAALAGGAAGLAHNLAGRGEQTATTGRPDSSAPASPADLGLTERQLEVLALMMRGKSNKLICRALDLAEPTVKNHVSAILKALSVVSRTEAVVAATELGWKLPEPRR